MERFFIEPTSIHANSIRTTDFHLIHQMKHVLRLRPDDQCVFLDNSGFEFLAKITRLDEKEMTAAILEKRKNQAEPTLFVTLYQALPKKMELFEWVLQKGTEIGVSEFIPLITERTERREIPKRERLEKILKEAAEQCERGKIPELKAPVEFELAIQNQSDRPNRSEAKQLMPSHGWATFGAKILLHSRGDFPLLSEKLSELKTQSKISLFIGPEGGFTDNEMKIARENRLFIYSLGPRILRTESAGIVASTCLII